MNKQLLTLCALLASAALFLSGCSTKEVEPKFQAENLEALAPGSQYVQKADTFYVIHDNSASMTDFDGNQIKANIAKAIAVRLNATIPASIKLKGAMQVFGPAQSNGGDSAKIYGISDYVRNDMGKAIDSKIGIPGGSTPLGNAIKNAQADLATETGRIALIVISDGEETFSASAVAAAKQMKTKFGDRLCIYAIRIGESETGKKLMREIAKESGCGFAVAADHILTGKGMAAFVQRVFFDLATDRDGDGVLDKSDMCPATPVGVTVDTRGCPVDSDNDGIADFQDRCPNTPPNTWVNAVGCPAKQKEIPTDQDRDGVVDTQDRCPNTPLGAKVNADGCWPIAPILFDHNKHFIKASEYGKLEEMSTVMKANPSLKLRLDGHTDNTATPEYNMPLSRKRTEAVRGYFLKMGIDDSRIITQWFGLSRPTSSNNTPDGKAKNRRVEMTPSF